MAHQLLLPCLLPTLSPGRITRTAVDPFMTVVISNHNNYSRGCGGGGTHNLYYRGRGGKHGSYSCGGGNHNNYIHDDVYRNNNSCSPGGGSHNNDSYGGGSPYGGKHDSYSCGDGNYNNYIHDVINHNNYPHGCGNHNAYSCGGGSQTRDSYRGGNSNYGGQGSNENHNDSGDSYSDEGVSYSDLYDSRTVNQNGQQLTTHENVTMWGDANYSDTVNQNKQQEELGELEQELSKIAMLVNQYVNQKKQQEKQQEKLGELEQELSKITKLVDKYVNQKKQEEKQQKKLDELEQELSKIVGLEELKIQLRKWTKRMLMDDKRRSMGMELGPRKSPHMVFLGNPGTGKTMVARILCKLLYSVGVLWEDKLTEVQRSDLVGKYIGSTAIKTREKIEEAMGGVLFVDEAYRLAMKDSSRDYGVEALEEIMSVMEDGNIVVIFAGYTEQMKRVFSTNEGFTRRVTNFFQFDDFSCNNLAEMLMIKMTNQNKKSRLYGFKLHHSCTLEAVCALIEQNSTKKLRSKLNGGLVDHVLNNARENLDSRLNFDAKGDDLVTITLQDLEVGVQVLTDRLQVELGTESVPFWVRLFDSPPHIESVNKK